MSLPARNNVSVITTVFNEGRNIADMLLSLRAQSRLPSEVVIVDAGSSDGTTEIIERMSRDAPFPIRLIVAPGANRSRGRNLAIAAARGPLIAATDAGCRAEPRWLEYLLQPLENAEAEVASGFYQAEAATPLEAVIAALTVPQEGDINPDTFLPSSRSVAFLKQAWEKVQGYPENYECAEDTRFDLSLRQAGFRFKFVPQAKVRWRMQGSLSRLYRQFREYAKSDARARLLWAHYWKVPAGLLILLLLSLLAGLGWGLLLTVLLALAYYFGKGLKAARITQQGARAVVLGMLVAATVDLAHFVGYLKGLLAGRYQRSPA